MAKTFSTPRHLSSNQNLGILFGLCDSLRCFNLSNGEELWNFGNDAPGSVSFPGSRSVLIVDGNHVYSSGHNVDLYCLNINTLKPVWNVNVWTDFGVKSIAVS